MLIGEKFNRWTVIGEPYKQDGKTLVRVRCSCSTEAIKNLASIRFGQPKSCGCLRKEVTSSRNKQGRFEVTLGARYGRLVVKEELPTPADGYRVIKCLCDCGQDSVTPLSSLLSGASKSCGCFRSDVMSARNRTHGKSKTPIYRVWRAMKERCEDTNCAAYPNYGGRGISVCKEWSESFESFYADMGEAPYNGATLEREDNDGDYKKDNVRWATRAEQAANTRRNKWYTYKGQPALLKDIAAAEQVNLGTLYYRLNTAKLTIEEALASPVNTRSRK